MVSEEIQSSEETFFDMDRVLADLVSSDDRAPYWLRQSYAEPRRFVHELYERFRKSQATSVRSRAHMRYDFYQDMVLRHTEQNRVAFTSYVSGSALDISYDELHQRSSRLVAAWTDAGVGPGMHLCIALSFDEDYLVALMTALRLGTLVTLVPKPATLLAKRQIEWSGAAAVVVESADVEHVPEGMVVLPPRSQQTPLGQTQLFAYPTETPCMLLFSAFAGVVQAPETLREVTADAIFTGALRDALLTFGLRSNDRVAAPGFDVVQYQPQFLLMTLLAGARYIHIPAQVLEESSYVRQHAAPTLLGISAALRDSPQTLTDTLTSNVRLWFRSMTERLDLHRWEGVEKRFQDRSIRCLGIASNAAFGGAFAFSKRRVKQLALALFPAPGEPWLLEETNRSGLPALGSAGLLSHPDDPDRLGLGQFIFSWLRERYSMGASIDFSRSGRAVFISLYERLVLDLEQVAYASLILAQSDAPNDSSLLLVCFVDPLRGGGEDGTLAGRVAKEVKGRVEARLISAFGRELLPDRIAIYTIRPRLSEEGKLDRRWCRDQYLSGTLARKQAHPTFRALSQLNKVMQLMQET